MPIGRPLPELPPLTQDEILRYSRHLQAAGFRRVWNLDGGILRWSEEIDPSVPRY
ncbi:MAG TPA: hypothetical protein VFR85_00705 [Anaeromyxobacteraceae bacterium]|nr:hypothetical protein [Anaeromyxobacteraceae bacterium]